MTEKVSWKPFLAIAFIVPTIVMGISYLMTNMDIWGIFTSAVILYTMFPLIIMGIYMWVSGSGHRWINGPDWTKMSENTRVQASRTVGIWIAISTFVLAIGMAVMFHYMGKSLAIGMGAFVISLIGFMALIFYPIVKVSRKSFEEEWRYKTSTGPSKGKAIAAVLIFSIAIIPIGLVSAELGGNGEITVTLNDDDFSVKGPMFDHTFAYNEVDSIELDPKFDKGKRISGYGTSTIKSGNFRNDELGDYKLASYAKIMPCIVIIVDGEYYAFNQSSDKLTEDLYDKLMERIPVPDFFL